MPQLRASQRYSPGQNTASQTPLPVTHTLAYGTRTGPESTV